MLRFVLLLLVMPACLAEASLPQGRSVDDLLNEALRQRYPEVKRWEVKAMGNREAAANMADIGDTRIEVMQLGVRSAVRVESSSGRQSVDRRILWFAVSGFNEVPSAARAARAGEPLGAADVVMLEKDIIAAGCAPAHVDFADPARRWRTKSRLRPGEVICANDIEPKPAVARGEQVQVTYASEALTLTSRGVAQNDGSIGQRIPVRSLGSREVFQGTVSGVAEVTVHD